MRLSTTLTSAVLIGFISIELSAQHAPGSPLAAQIADQQMVTRNLPGNSDGTAWLKLAVLCQNAARYRDSEDAYRRAIALLRSGDRATLADALDRMGTMYVECGAFARAWRLEQRALRMREGEKDASATGVSHAHLSALLLGKGNFARAEDEARMAVRLLVPERDSPAPQATSSPDDQMSALVNLSLAACARGACAGTVPDLRRALRIAHLNYPGNSIPVGFVDFLLGYALWKAGDEHSAGESMSNGTRELATQLGWGHPMYVRVMRQYGVFLAQTGHAGEANEIRSRIASFRRAPGTVDVQSLLLP